MDAGAIGDRSTETIRPTGTTGTTGRRVSGGRFPKELARAERLGRSIGLGGSRPLSRNGLAAARSIPPGVAVRQDPRATLLRRRGEADQKDERLVEYRDIDRFVQLAAEWRTVSSPDGARADSPTASTLAAAVEQLELALERQQRAEGPALEMQFGRRLRIRLTRGRGGLELAISGDREAARLARSELPALVARLRERGLTVAHTEVRTTVTTKGQGSSPAAAWR